MRQGLKIAVPIMAHTRQRRRRLTTENRAAVYKMFAYDFGVVAVAAMAMCIFI